jgi:hypothetical protein
MNDSHSADPSRRIGNDFKSLAVPPRQACLLFGISNLDRRGLEFSGSVTMAQLKA